MKYGILMPYLDRLPQLRMTLVSFRSHYAHRDDWRAVIMVDRKETKPQEIASMVTALGMENRCLVFGPIGNGSSNTPCAEYNQAAAISDADYVLPTNPECLHLTDILGELDKLFAVDPNRYVVCACEAVARVSMPHDDMAGLAYKHVDWYQHSKHHNPMLNFCTAISRNNYNRIGGFDPAYSGGLGYADNDFINKIKAAGLPLVVRDDMIALHLEHPVTHGAQRKELVRRNRLIYEGRKAKAGVR